MEKMLIKPLEMSSVLSICRGNKGPRTEPHKIAQQAIDQFIESDADACLVEWKEISENFVKAQQILSGRISWTRFHKKIDIGMRSRKKLGELYLIRKDRLDDRE